MNIWKNASHWFFILREALIVCLYMYACRERRKRERRWRVRWASKGSKWSTRYVKYLMVGSLFPFFPSFYWIIYYSTYQFVYLDVCCAMQFLCFVCNPLLHWCSMKLSSLKTAWLFLDSLSLPSSLQVKMNLLIQMTMQTAVRIADLHFKIHLWWTPIRWQLQL